MLYEPNIAAAVNRICSLPVYAEPIRVESLPKTPDEPEKTRVAYIGDLMYVWVPKDQVWVDWLSPELDNADEIDWTCPNCNHQSPVRTFDILEKQEKLLKEAREILISCDSDACNLWLEKTKYLEEL